MIHLLAILLIAGSLVAAVSDLTTRKIPNWLAYPFAAAAFVLHSSQGVVAGSFDLLVMGAVLAASLPVFAFGWLRGGDVKMIVACCGMAGFPFCLPFLLYTMLCGGAVALVAAWRYGTLKSSVQTVGAVVHPLLYGTIPAGVQFSTNKIPYGVAILGGASLTVLAMTCVPALRLL